MAAAAESGVTTVHCYEAVWTDRLGERRSIVIVPRRGEPAMWYVARHLPWIVHQDRDSYSWAWDVSRDPYDPAFCRHAGQRHRAMKERRRIGLARMDIKAWHVMISSSVPITMSPAEAEVCADASDVMLAAVGRADATWTAAGVRAGRWWNALLAERVRERARRRYRKVMDTAARRYADAVGDLPARVRAEIVRAERDLRQRQSDRAEELRRRSEARRRVLGGGE